MGKVIFNLVNGERYGDVNDPKTRWTTHGIVMLDDSADDADIEAFKRLLADRKISLRVESTPTSKNWDGWLSIFERTARDGAAPAQSNNRPANTDDITIGDDPINLDDIPF